MADNWAEKFQKKLKQKEIATKEAVKDFNIYKEQVLILFEMVERKVKEVSGISVNRVMMAQTSNFRENVPGPFETIKAISIKFQNKYIEFLPEGINLDSSKGRIRIKHNTRNLSQFIYLHLIKDSESKESYPKNLMWAYNLTGDAENFEDLPKFDEEKLEVLMEKCFLE